MVSDRPNEKTLASISTFLQASKNNYASAEFDSAKYYADAAVKFITKTSTDSIRYINSLAVAYNKRGNANRVLGNYDSAWHDYNSSLNISESYNNDSARFSSFYGLAVLFYYNQEQSTKAESTIAWEYINEAAKMMKDSNDTAKIIYFKCESYINANRLDSAKKYFNSLSDIVYTNHVLNSRKYEAYIWEDSAKIMILESQYGAYQQEIINAFDSSLFINEHIGRADSVDLYQVEHVLLHKGNYLLKFYNHIDSAFLCLTNAYNLANKLNDAYVKMKAARGISSYYDLIRNRDSAYAYLYISDSINSILMRKSLFNIYTKGIDEKRNISNQKGELIKMTDWLRVLITVLTILSLLGGGLFILVYFKNKRRRNELNRKNEWEKISHEMLDLKDALLRDEKLEINDELNKIVERLKNHLNAEYCGIILKEGGNIKNSNYIFNYELNVQQKVKFDKAIDLSLESPLVQSFLEEKIKYKFYNERESDSDRSEYLSIFKNELLKSQSIKGIILIGLYKIDSELQKDDNPKESQDENVLGYVCIVNPKIEINTIEKKDKEPLNFFSSSMSTIFNIYIYRKKDIIKLKDQNFIRKLKEKQEGLDSVAFNLIFEEIATYFIEQFNLNVISFRIPIIEGETDVTSDDDLGHKLWFPLRCVKANMDKLKSGYTSAEMEELYLTKREKLLLHRLSYRNEYSEEFHKGVHLYSPFNESTDSKNNENKKEFFKEGKNFALFIRDGLNPVKTANDFWKSLFCIINLRSFEENEINNVLRERLKFLTDGINDIFNEIFNKKRRLQIRTIKKEIDNLSVSQKSTYEDIAWLVLNSIKAKICSVFLFDQADEKLKLKATTAKEAYFRKEKINLQTPEGIEKVFYGPEDEEESITLKTQKDGRTRLYYTVKDVKHSIKFQEIPEEGKHEDYSILFVPLKATFKDRDGKKETKVLGVLKCFGKTAVKDALITSFWDFDSETVELVAALATRLIEIDKTNKDKDFFMNQIVHEILTPITGLFGNLDEGEQRYKRNMDDLKSMKLGEYFADNMNMITLVKKMLEDLDDVSKGTYDTKKLEIKSVDIKNLLIELKKLHEKQASESKGIWIKTYMSEMPEFMMVDESKMNQVFNNLLKNAVNYSESRSEVKIKYYKTYENHPSYNEKLWDKWHEIKFVNNGLGILESEKEDVFLLFRRGSNSGISKNVKLLGSGIGLFLVDKLMKRQGGLCVIRRLKNPTEISILIPAIE